MRIFTSIAICVCLQTATPAAASSPCQRAAYRPAAQAQCVLATRDAPQPAGFHAAVVRS